MQDNYKNVTITLLDAVNILSYGWHSVLTTTIRNCFANAGLITIIPSDSNDAYLSKNSNNSDDLAMCAEKFFEYVDADNHVLTKEKLTDQEIVESILQEKIKNKCRNIMTMMTTKPNQRGLDIYNP
ncbi:unnamed protein product [Hermetia illucens]|uniref:Uncharacterized protein n=1 Tax=Hermetia illucens TaxID=343691 RepID=A0A7R8UBQ4_HERIL|nr:unnamed protein product [Hermetia illucens]